MFRNFTMAILAALTTLMCFGLGTAAAGDLCKSFDIKVKNESSNHIKVTKLEYYDYDASKWRSEATLTRKINPGQSYTFDRGLEHVDNDDTKIKVSYKIQSGGSRWGSTKTVMSSKFVCRDYGRRTITIN